MNNCERITIYGIECEIAHVVNSGENVWRLKILIDNSQDFGWLVEDIEWPDDRFTGLDHFKLCLQLENPFEREKPNLKMIYCPYMPLITKNNNIKLSS